MKKFVRIVFVCAVFLLAFHPLGYAQNAIVGSAFSTGWGGACGSNANFTYLSASAGTSYIVTRNSSGTGNQYWRMGIDWGGIVRQIHLNTGGTDVSVTPGTKYTLVTNTCVTAGAMFYNVGSTSHNYIFKTQDAGSAPTGGFVFFEVQGTVRTLSSHTAPTSSAVYPGITRRLTVTLSGTLNTGQVAYIRYHNGAGFGSATITALTYSGSGNDYFVDIPASVNSVGSTVTYYFFTSGTTVPSNADADLYTINLLNNSGSNYSYTVSGTWQTANAGSWGTAATWNANAVPPTAQSIGAVTVGHNVTLNQDATVSSITINSGVTLTGSDGNARTLTVASGGTFTNNSSTSGGYNATATGNVTFAGSGTIAGSQSTTFNTAVLNGALTGSFSVASGGTVTMNSTSSVSGTVTTVGSATFNGSPGASSFASLTLNGVLTLTKSSTINGTLTMNSGASVTSTSPTYGASSTLVYATAMTEGLEWPSASGPQNVTLNSSIGTITLSANVHVNGGILTINNGSTLDVSASNFGLTLASGSTFANSGSFTQRSGLVTFSGGATINGATATTFNDIAINGTTTLTTAPTINGTLTMNSGSSIVTNSPVYGASALLNYNRGGGSGAKFNQSLEWPSANPPNAVSITNNTWVQLTANRTLAGNLTVTNGALQATGGTARTLTMNGGTQTITISTSTGGAIYGTDNGTGNDLQLVITNGSTTTLTGDATGSADDEKKFHSVTVNTGGTLALSRGLLCKYGTFSVSGSLQINNNGYVQSASGVAASYSTGTLVYNNGGSYTATNLEWPATNSPANVTIQNSGTNVTLNGAKTVSGILALTNGTLTVGANTLTISGSISRTSGLIDATNTSATVTFANTVLISFPATLFSSNTIRNLTLNGSGGIALGASLTITNTLTLTSGNITLGTFDLTLSSAVSGGGASSYVNTNSTGQLLNVVAATARLFPVGNGSYNPITLTNSGTSDTYGIRVVNGSVANTNDNTKAVNRSWYITEMVSGGSNLTPVIAQYNSGDVGTNFVAGTTPYLSFYNGTTWTQVATTLAGANPFTATSTGSSQYPSTIPSGSYFAVGKDDAFLGIPLPTISSFTTSGYTGSTITINGTDFTNASAVTFGGVAAASYTVNSATQITATVSTGTSGSVAVTTPGGTATLAGFTYLGYVSNASTDWNTAATWLGGNVPPASANVTIAHAVTLNSAATNTTFNNLTINSGSSLTFGASGAITIAGTLSNSGSVVMASGGNLTMAASAILANGSATFTAGSGTVTFAGAGTVSGTITVNNITVNGIVALSNAVTVNGNLQINTSGGISSNAPIYGSNSTLIYNSTANPYNVATEWTGNSTSAGAGVPQNVTIASTNNVVMPSTDRGLAGNLLISAGTFTLNATSGDLYVAGNFTQNSNFTNNGRLVVFNGSAAQTVAGSGTVSFTYLSNRNSHSGGLTLAKDLSITGTVGDVLRIRNAGPLNIGNGITLTISGNGGNILLDGATGGTTKTINLNDASSLVSITGLKTVTSTSSATLSVTSTVSGGTVAISNGVDFGSGLTTFANNAILKISSGGYVSTNPPTYSTGSTLQYDGVTSYGASAEWATNAASGVGVPFHVTLNNATINFGSATAYRQCNGNFTIGTGSAITLSSAVGGDLRIGGSGNWINQNSVVGNGLVSNNRALIFVGNADQQMSNTSGTTTVGYLLNSKTGGNLILNNNLNLNGTAGGTAQVLQLLSSSALDLNGYSVNIPGDQARSILVNATGRSITGSTNSEIIFASGVSVATIDQSAGVGTLVTDNNVKITLNKGVNFGSGVTTINGTLQINANGSCNTNSPIYGSAGTLLYTSGNYTTNNEWLSGTSVGAGVPFNVTINLASSSNTVTLAGNRSVKGALTFTQGKLTIASNTLTLDGTLSGTGIVGGSTSNLVIGGTGAFGTLTMDNGTPGTTNLLNNFTLNRTSGGTISLGTDVHVSGFFTPTAGTLTFGGNKILLKSTSISNTAQVGVVGSGARFVYNGSDGIQAERFLNSTKRGYRNIASGGIISNAYIYENWQESAATVSGYGTHITGLRGAAGNDATTGLDKTASGNSSLWTYTTADAFAAVSNTKTKQLLPFEGYMATIRGDRTIDLFSFTPEMNAASTTLRVIGKLCYGTVTLSSDANPSFTMAAPPSSSFRLNKNTTPSGKSNSDYGYSLIANPYPCAVNWGSVYSRSNGASYSNGALSPYFWVWQQQANAGAGAWVTVDNSGNVNVGGLNINEYLQPGQSVFVQNDHTGNPLIIEFQEADKFTTDNTKLKNVFGEVNASVTHKLRINLLKQNIVTDGALVQFSANETNDINIFDAPKMANSTENIAIRVQTRDLSIEKRALPTVADTISMRLWNVTAGNKYALSIDASTFNPTLQAYLYDKLTNSKQAISQNTVANLDFEVSSDLDSYQNRFFVVFEEPTPLPVLFTQVSATQNAGSNTLVWQTNNELLMLTDSYIIEKSNDGKSFISLSTAKALQTASVANYTFVDEKGANADAYYRIKTNSLVGKAVYSKTLFVKKANSIESVLLYPTIVHQGNLNLYINKANAGVYTVQVVSVDGKLLHQQVVNHLGGTSVNTINLQQLKYSGSGFVKISNGTEILSVKKIIIE